MDLKTLLLQIIVLLLITDVDSWRRRRRRRRRRGCTRVNCSWSWGGWSTCPCGGTHSRSMVIHRHPHCHGTACPAKRSETRSCVPVTRKHCQMTWGAWGSCSCSGKQSRSTVVRQQPQCGGNACPAQRTETRSCVPSNRKNCNWQWSTWSACTCGGDQTRSIIVTQQTVCGGTACPSNTNESQRCIPENRKNCIWSWEPWSACNCDGKRARKRTITQKAECGGVACPTQLNETGICQKPIRDCQWSWNAWSACECPGSRNRTLSIHAGPQCGGISCPTKTEESGNCIPENRKNCIWSWKEWSSCSCDQTRERTRTITQNVECGGEACPTELTETGSCEKLRRDCQWLWGTWSTCECSGRRMRIPSITSEPQCGGTGCPTNLKEYGSCVPDGRRDCTWLWEPWSDCNCNQTRTRTRTISQTSECGGVHCPTTLIESGNCQKPTRDCKWAWNAWSACECPGKRFRTPSILTHPQCGGVNCPLNETGSCISVNKTDCIWQWSPWSYCSCFQKRERSVVIVRNDTCGGNVCPKQITQPDRCSWGACVNGSGVCSNTNGSCICIAGKTGLRCEQDCPSGTYGLKCQFNCSCPAGIQCDPKTGKCCSPRRYGVDCLKELRWYIKSIEVVVDVDD